MISVLPPSNGTSRINVSTAYHVPNTKTTLHLTAYDRLVPVEHLKRVILQIGTRAKEHIQVYGDGWLSDADDPYTVEIPGCAFFAKSNPNPGPPMAPGMPGRQQHLTYGILISVAAGLWQWMIIGDHLDVIQFEIEDSQWGIVGRGSITPY